MSKYRFLLPGMFRTLLLWTLILGACSTGGLSPEASSSNPFTDTPSPVTMPASTTQVLALTEGIATVTTPQIDQSPDGNLPNTADSIPTVASSGSQCEYQWAYEDLPELSRDFQLSIQQLQAEAEVSVFAFGENCIHADGSADFIPMETDFNVTLQVNDVYNESDLGGWIVKVMQIIENIPPDQIIGPRPGRVTIIFQSGDDEQNVIFYIDQYQKLPPNLSDLQVFTQLKSP